MVNSIVNMPISLFNTLSRSREIFEPIDPDRVSMYVCGPTVYNFAHIGNARPAVVFDILVRLLRQRFSKVIYARNFTDVDDKINAAALAANVPIDVITAQYIAAYHLDMQALQVIPPDLEPRVTEHIPQIVELIEKLIARGNAYEVEGHVLFAVGSFKDYGKLSGRQTQDMLAGARVEVAPYKRNPLDFVLWKPSGADQPGWPSPWGRGRPGWHVECSAMIEKHLGQTIDIHGGGQDLIFPHHENEIAQGTCAHDGALYCKTWVHNSFVTVNGQKMSKSLGNVLLVRDLLKQVPGEAIRLALLSTHYSSPLDWNERRLTSACQTLSRFYRSLDRVAHVPEVPNSAPDVEFFAALANDLNVSEALARLHKLVAELDKAATLPDQQRIKSSLLASATLLGLLHQAPAEALAELGVGHNTFTDTTDIDPVWVERLIALRNEARSLRDFKTADDLRDELKQAGVVIEDNTSATTWWRSVEAKS